MCSTNEIAEAPDLVASLEGMPRERLEAQITELAAHINAATCRWLLLVGEFERRELWADWGCKSCSHWLSYRCGLSPAAGREQVRVARSLAGLPATRAAFGRGELCYSQVRALTRIASPETEGDLIMVARHATAGQLEVIVRAYRGLLARAAGTTDRFVRLDHDDDDGSLLLRARLPADEGALVVAALEAGRDAIRAARTPAPGRAEHDHDAGAEGLDGAAGGSASAETTLIGDSGAEDPAVRAGEPAAGGPPVASNADALVLMAQTLLSTAPAERTGSDGYQVVVHVDTATLADPDEDADGGPCQLDNGSALHPETARRLACDASLVRILERDGRPLSVGRKTRTVPPALRRALKARDQVCRFPGCPQRRFLHAHHIRHWANGGRTDLSNLVQLCSHHHRLVHEGGYTIEPGAHGTLRFRRPDQRPLPATTAHTTGRPDELERRHTQQGLRPTDQTCVPCIYPGDRIDLEWQIANLAETDTRLTPI
jgi:Domain of unknown function (DUF222)/HNH endonuclease